MKFRSEGKRQAVGLSHVNIWKKSVMDTLV